MTRYNIVDPADQYRPIKSDMGAAFHVIAHRELFTVVNRAGKSLTFEKLPELRPLRDAIIRNVSPFQQIEYFGQVIQL